MRKLISIIFISSIIFFSISVAAIASPFSTLESLTSKRTVARKKISRTTQIEHAIRKVFGPDHDDTAVCIAVNESVGGVGRRFWHFGDPMVFNTKAWSPTGDHGLFQINYQAHHNPGESESEFHHRMSRTWYNINWAYRLSNGGKNWYPWTGTYARGACRGLS